MLVVILDNTKPRPASDYCAISPGHTLCLYNERELGPDCGAAKLTVVTEAEKKAIVDLHNEYRRKVATGNTHQPKAANMREMESIYTMIIIYISISIMKNITTFVQNQMML